MKATEELRQRIESKKKDLQSEYHRLQAEHGAAQRERKEEIEKQLSDLGAALEKGIDNLKEDVAKRLNALLDR